MRRVISGIVCGILILCALFGSQEFIFGVACVVLVFCVLIGSHEFGHLIAAKIFGVKVPVCSIGFGPKLIGFKFGETEYRISLILLGGYVKILNEEELILEKDLRNPQSVSGTIESKPRWKQMIIMAAGCIANLILAVMLFFFMFHKIGFELPTLKVHSVAENSPAKEAGIKENDILVSVDDYVLKNFYDLFEKVNNGNGKEIVINVKREKESLSFKVKPKLLDGAVWDIGVIPVNEKKLLNFKRSLTGSFKITAFFVNINFDFLKKVAKKTTSSVLRKKKEKDSEDLTKALSGPVGISSLLYKTSKEKDIGELLHVLAILSVCLGFLNLLPIPILDGGHILFLLIEVAIGRTICKETKAFWAKIGIILIIFLLILGTKNDFQRGK